MFENDPGFAPDLQTRDVDPDFRRQLKGYSLATAKIYFRLPDALDIIDWLLVQKYDYAPHFPVFRAYFNWWHQTLDGPIHSVEIAHAQLIRPTEFRYVGQELVLH